ncbi:MAG: KamA family radical SAM protein [Deltaproteobacteria bacterium]|nr:KamA family radical SAM protein [Deltaproteobacteria bacterium]
MEIWQKKLRESLVDPEELAARFKVDAEPLKKVCAIYPLRITPHYLDLIREPGDPLWRQVVPDVRELDSHDRDQDPLNEEGFSPLPGIVHRYGDRVLFLVAGHCAAYCRFCTRKRLVGRTRVSFAEVMAGIAYIASTPAVRDVLLSGGDPLLMEDRLLQDILARLRRIPHVEIIRIGTRLPVTLPERITENLCTVLKKFHPLFINTHFNHPVEITPEAAEACARLADAGIPLGNQTVLLRGVNDSAEILAELFRKLLQIRVRPYYLHQMDLTAGTDHFRTSVDSGLEIMAALRGTLSGLGIPTYVIDLPGGKGKVPILPDYVQSKGTEIVLRSPCGDLVSYPNCVE